MLVIWYSHNHFSGSYDLTWRYINGILRVLSFCINGALVFFFSLFWQRRGPSAEMVMLDRMVLQDERMNFEYEKQLAKNPGMYLIIYPSSDGLTP